MIVLYYRINLSNIDDSTFFFINISLYFNSVLFIIIILKCKLFKIIYQCYNSSNHWFQNRLFITFLIEYLSIITYITMNNDYVIHHRFYNCWYTTIALLIKGFEKIKVILLIDMCPNSCMISTINAKTKLTTWDKTI